RVAQLRLEAAQVVRQARAQFEIAMVDRAQLDAQAAVGGLALGTRESGHAADHCAGPSVERAGNGKLRGRFAIASPRMPMNPRPRGRAPDQLRPISFERRYTRHAEGSVLVSFGDTRVLCTASVEDKVPPFLRGAGRGWLTAEYGMLPRATHTRGEREAARGRQSGRTQEIQRLIGRSLRAVFDLERLG